MVEPVGNSKYAQERAIAGTESRAQLLSRKRTTGNANPNSVRDAPRLRGRLLNGPTRQTVFVHVPVHNEKQKYCERSLRFLLAYNLRVHIRTPTHTTYTLNIYIYIYTNDARVSSKNFFSAIVS